MDSPAFGLQDCLIAYGDGKQATCISRQFDGLGNREDEFIIGVFDFSDDHSVHADHWERHPDGDEILCVLEGRVLATVDRDGAAEETVIEQGMAFIVPRRSWHRLRVLEPGRLLFITPPAGSELRAVDNHTRQITEGRPT